MKPRCSVVIATRNRSGSLTRTLERLLSQDLEAPYEVIVVDNGSTGDTAARVKEWAGSHPAIGCALEPQRGPVAARDTGVDLAREDTELLPRLSYLPDLVVIAEVQRERVTRRITPTGVPGTVIGRPDGAG